MSTKLQLWKGLDLSNYVCEYEVNRPNNEKVVRGKRNFNANCLRRRTHAHPDGLIVRIIWLIKQEQQWHQYHLNILMIHVQNIVLSQTALTSPMYKLEELDTEIKV